MTEEFKFYTEEQLIELSSDLGLAFKRKNKMMQISRLSHAVRCIVSKMGFEKESQLKNAELKGEVFDNSLYDAYLLSKFQLQAAQKKIGEMPALDKKIDVVAQFFYEVQKDDPEYWKEMKEVAADACARVAQKYHDTEQ
tara:strand:+ start:986 stop:1402 length:417 start_codon:yes stop_codon:yes gene_type:complete